MGTRIIAAASDTRNAAPDPAVPPPPVLGAPDGATEDGDVVGHPLGGVAGHWDGDGEAEGSKGDGASDGSDGDGEADGSDGDGSSAIATPLAPPSTTTESDATANRRSHSPFCRRARSRVPCGDPFSYSMCTTTPLRSQSRTTDLELLGFASGATTRGVSCAGGTRCSAGRATPSVVGRRGVRYPAGGGLSAPAVD